jgi:hypothetical protein
VIQPRLLLAEKLDVHQVQAINPRAIKLSEPVISKPAASKVETFKDAKGAWLNLVMFGLFLLGAASVLAVFGVRHEMESPLLIKFKTGFVAALGGPKLFVLNELLRASETKNWALGSLIAYALGVLALMWPERVGIMGLAGIGRLIACLMAAAALIFGIDLLQHEPFLSRLLKVGGEEVLTWLIFLDMAAMILVNMRVSGIAARGGFHALAKFVGGMMAVQVSGILILLFALNVPHKGMGLMWASAGAYACGGVGVALVGVFLVLRIAWEFVARDSKEE